MHVHCFGLLFSSMTASGGIRAATSAKSSKPVFSKVVWVFPMAMDHRERGRGPEAAVGVRWENLQGHMDTIDTRFGMMETCRQF